MLEKANIYLIDPQSGTRTRLKEALRQVVSKLSFSFSTNIDEALKVFERADIPNYIFVSSAFSDAEIEALLQSAQQRASGKPISLIVILQSHDQDGNHVAALLSLGVQGFLCEPFSSVEILELLQRSGEIATQTHSNTDMARSSAWLLVGSAIAAIDEAAEQVLQGNAAGGRGMKMLKEQKSTLERIVHTLGMASYENVCLDRFDEAKTNKKESKIRVHIGGPAPHPGEFLLEKIQGRNLTVEKISAITKIPEEELQGILDQRMSMSKESARKISLAIGGSIDYWMKLQAAYDRSPKGRAEKSASLQGEPAKV